MKKFLLLLFIVTVLPSFTIQSPAGFSIIGKWQCISKSTGKTTNYVFDSMGYVSLEKGGKFFNGKGYEINGSKYQITYKVDMASTPLRIDVVMLDVTNNQKKTRKGVFKINNANEIIMILAPRERIMDLKSKDAITYKRIKT